MSGGQDEFGFVHVTEVHIDTQVQVWWAVVFVSLVLRSQASRSS